MHQKRTKNVEQMDSWRRERRKFASLYVYVYQPVMDRLDVLHRKFNKGKFMLHITKLSLSKARKLFPFCSLVKIG